MQTFFTFDLFGEGWHIYTFENRCIQNLELGLGDETTKIILNTKGTSNDRGWGPAIRKDCPVFRTYLGAGTSAREKINHT